MNSKFALLGVSAFACLMLMNSCTTVGEHKTSPSLYYLNFTKADTEEYDFLRTVYQLASDEIAFAQVVSQRGTSANVKSLADNLSNQYGEVLSKLSELADEANVLLPFPGQSTFELTAGLDSAGTNVLEKVYVEQSLHNQEYIIHQFKNVTNNTKLSTNRYASEVLPILKKTKEETEALL
ncbi:DUF4142 domain-containing protein [Olivibacter sp. SDN3]|uniref:DUF4142 domain-containing protein n=1 Tax=Olivibacter sp. SDN3 TaxID=2764720 RepID=UPI001650D7CE|nr:DUF4142 domain-containing protein [Olivibacter sp. SDN3]QNL48448.1 DUF4142 domain-containing protein [Olivibacter sp. SDN3]